MERIYLPVIKQHLASYRQMVFLAGPRQAGKTTLSKSCLDDQYILRYLNWDVVKDRAEILGGIDNLSKSFKTEVLKAKARIPILIFDEIHKYRAWKSLLKGYFDTFENEGRIIVTGSAKLDVYRKGGDSMMGRYFLYRVHPLSVSECLQNANYETEYSHPKQVDEETWQKLFTYGGFPEPFLNNDELFYRRWQKLRHHQLFKEDIRDLTKVHEIARLELLAELVKENVSHPLEYASLAKKVQVSEPTIKKWLSILNSVYYCFTIRPWKKNITRSLIKKPKIYLWDWSIIEDKGARIENFVACHLLKAVQFWTDIGFGEYQLYFIRDKDKKEVDFLITKDQKPWVMVEVKSSPNNHISKNLHHFHKILNTPHTFQAVYDMPYVERDCFAQGKPTIVPLRTLLSQLV